MSSAFSFEKTKDSIGILTFDLPGEKVNKFDTETMRELSGRLDQLKDMTDLKCLLLMSKKPGIFIAGADINEILSITDEERGYDVARQGQDTFAKIGKLPFPSVAVIDGACMGGGTEISLNCTYRLATDNEKTRIALPEVNLGLLPGWSGTTRLPRLIGIQRTLDIILTGRHLNARRAYRSGLIDKIIPAEWAFEKAIEFVGEIINGKTKHYIKRRKPRGLVNAIVEKTPLGRKIMFSKLIASNISKNLIQIFFWTEEVKKENGTTNPELKGLPVNKTAVLGAGVMGGGIAQLFAGKEIPVRVKDINYEAVAKAYQQAARVLKGKRKRRRITELQQIQIMNRISGTVDYSGFRNSDLVIEAIVENLDIKKKVLSELEQHIRQETVIATNTSSLRVDDMAESLKNKDRFVGLHFFNPVHRMPLVEVVRGKFTSDETVATVFNLSKKLGKTPIAVNDG
ncbi:MAG: 3-hydroxyacyl-CoA dehydrogenase NAD-binding domain-containing protein, partial [Calditrichaceae bacterium]